MAKAPTLPTSTQRLLVLASTSPRRIELCQTAGLSFVTRSPDVDETPVKGEGPRAMVARLAREKARAVAEAAAQEFGSVRVIAADTTVVAPGSKRILGKPADREGAIKMVLSLQGKTHEVLTAYCILDRDSKAVQREKTRVVSTRVSIRKLSRAQAEAYVDRCESMDKAGSYAAQGHGMMLIEQIRGSYTNVVGLPMSQLLADLDSLEAKR